MLANIFRRSVLRVTADAAIFFETTIAAFGGAPSKTARTVKSALCKTTPFLKTALNCSFERRCRLEIIERNLHRELLSSFCAATCDHFFASRRSHAHQKAVCLCALPFLRLVGSFHTIMFDFLMFCFPMLFSDLPCPHIINIVFSFSQGCSNFFAYIISGRFIPV